MATTTTTTTVKPTISATKADHSAYPPIESFLTIDGLLRSHASEHDQPPLVCYPVQTASDFEQHTAADVNRYVDTACEFYVKHGLSPAEPTLQKAPVVALLTPSSFEVVVTFFALNRLGYAVLFLSTRLTAPAYARLMGMVDCSAIIVPGKLNAVAQDIASERPDCIKIPMLSRSDWHGRPDAQPFARQALDRAKEASKIAWILHSSGSTGFPKPILLTNRQCLANWRKSFALRSFCVSPLFHGHALMELGRSFYTRSTMFLGNHSLPVTSATLLAGINAAVPQMVSAVPYVLKLLAEKRAGIEALAKTKLVMYAGSSCPDDLGDLLVSRGVNLVGNYGATETGQIMTSFRHFDTDKEWSYLRLWSPVAVHTLMDEIAPGVFECVALDGLPSKGPSNSVPPFSEKNPQNSFRTADLFTRNSDPSKSNFYKYLSRLDDRITLVNGEKVLPVPMEGTMRQHPMVQEAVIFGFQQTMPGALLFRSAGQGTELDDAEFLEQVWPTIELANTRAESFARITRDLVVVKGADVVYPRTDKNTAIRAQIYVQFARDIDSVYAKLTDVSSSGTKLALSESELQSWLLERFRKNLGIPLPDADSDIFAAGVDSLQTTRVWREIQKHLDLGESTQPLSQNVVFEQGNVRGLARYLHARRTGELAEIDANEELEVMQQLIDKYSVFPPHKPTLSTQPAQQTVLLTGVTGNLGAFILASLLQNADVAEVHCLIRASSTEVARTRLLQSVTSRQISLTSSQLQRVHVHLSDLSLPSLGLPEPILTHLRETLTCIIHSAWAVNFNLPVRSFETQHIAGTHHLISLALSSALPKPAAFFFCSSISSASGTPKPASISELPAPELRHAQATGYGRSKLVTERITHAAATATGMESRVLRIGQLSGDTQAAIWNETEAVALMIRSAVSTGCLPMLDEKVSWLPVDVCAEAVVEIALRDGLEQQAKDDLVYHLVNPKTFHWTRDLLPALRKCEAELGKFEVVGTSEWLDRLAKSEPDPAKNPSIKLLDFWRKKYNAGSKAADDGEDAPGLTFETKRTAEQCALLGEVGQVVQSGLMESE
ncbi:hypothetical protein B0A48_04259 [Cryoendolithus antarcticus]|uniref:Carrier domain-containing protein n=1 Tax=Cryoendolithus antarcticus TaxID=1507870 RepID=A0A1V8TEW3_9PEZI|nr:hypothetical protein B0A48_04259 [Cryoendolithus antarcticus]